MTKGAGDPTNVNPRHGCTIRIIAALRRLALFLLSCRCRCVCDLPRRAARVSAVWPLLHSPATERRERAAEPFKRRGEWLSPGMAVVDQSKLSRRESVPDVTIGVSSETPRAGVRCNHERWPC